LKILTDFISGCSYKNLMGCTIVHIQKQSGLLEGQILSSQSEQFKKLLKSLDWLDKNRPSKKPLLLWTLG